MSKVNFKTKITGLDGKVVKIGSKDNAEDMDLSYLAVLALTSQTEADKNLSGIDKVQRAVLAQEIYSAEEAVSLSSEDVTLIKDLVGNQFGPLFVQRAWAILDPKDSE